MIPKSVHLELQTICFEKPVNYRFFAKQTVS